MYSILPLATFAPDSQAVFVRVDANGYYMRVTLSYDASSESNNWEYASGNINADAVIYGGKIGAETANSVAMALDTLAVGNPLDMTADYTASGATSVSQWATMAMVADGVASTTEYRIAQGRYRITNDYTVYDVTVVDASVGTGRVVLISSVNNDPYWYFEAYSCTAPGSNVTNILFLSTEEGLLNFSDGCVRLLPWYDKSADSDDADKILMLKRSTVGGNTSVNPQWVALTNVAEEGA